MRQQPLALPLPKLTKQLLAIPAPSDYLQGRIIPPPLLPQNILFFKRTLASKLAGNPVTKSQHHRFVLITALTGSGKIGVDKEMHDLSQGHSLLILPFQSHCFVDVMPESIHWLFITFEHPPDARFEDFRDRGALPVDEASWPVLDALIKLWVQKDPSPMLQLYLSLYLEQLWRTTRSHRKKKSQPSEETRNSQMVAAVNRFAYEHRGEPIAIEQIARELGMSASLLRGRFHQATGKSVGRHVREFKLHYACELLLGTMLRVEEIAEKCGYDSIFSFSRAFRRTHGVSPSFYREQRP